MIESRKDSQLKDNLIVFLIECLKAINEGKDKLSFNRFLDNGFNVYRLEIDKDYEIVLSPVKNSEKIIITYKKKVEESV